MRVLSQRLSSILIRDSSEVVVGRSLLSYLLGISEKNFASVKGQPSRRLTSSFPPGVASITLPGGVKDTLQQAGLTVVQSEIPLSPNSSATQHV